MQNLESYKGVRDFYPSELNQLNYVFSVWRQVMASYGYEEYSASILEPSELYEAKTSDEIVNEQTYNFTDRGQRKVTLRPEMTPTLARMVAKQARNLNFPLRWYSVPNVFRYEQPQRGRLREHWQLNVDLVGASGKYADAEIIEIANQIMLSFKLTASDFVIKINDRNILDEVCAKYNLSPEKKKEFIRLLDRKDKTTDFEDAAFKILGKPFDMTIEPNHEIKQLIEILGHRGIQNIVFDPNLARGFDYYTGMVFEIFDTNPENRRAVFGGGRYDHLVSQYGTEEVPCVGFGMGDVTIQDMLELRGLMPETAQMTHIGLCLLDESCVPFANDFARTLRQEKLNVVVDYSFKKVSQQIEKFDKRKIPFIICIGEDEIKSKKVKVKTLISGKEKRLPTNKVARFVKKEIWG